MMSLVYIFCKKNPNQVFMFLFIFKIKAKYFPYAYIFYRVIEGAALPDLVIGILVGHSYLYFKEILPLSTGKQYIPTPNFMYF